MRQCHLSQSIYPSTISCLTVHLLSICIYVFIYHLSIYPLSIYYLSTIIYLSTYYLSSVICLSVCPSIRPSIILRSCLGKPYCTGEYSHGFSCEPTCAKYSMRHRRGQQVWDSGGRPEPGQCTLLAQCLSLRSKCQARERQGLDVGLRIWNVDDGDTQKVWLGKPIPSP